MDSRAGHLTGATPGSGTAPGPPSGTAAVAPLPPARPGPSAPTPSPVTWGRPSLQRVALGNTETGAGRPPLRAGHRSSFCNAAQWHPERFRGFQTGAQQRPAPLHETQRGVVMGDSCLIQDEAPAFRRIPAPHPTLPPDTPAEEGPDCVASRALPAGPPRQSPRAKAGGGPTRHRVPPPAQRWDPPRVSRGWSRLLREHRQCGRFQVQGAGLEPTAVRCPTRGQRLPGPSLPWRSTT